MLKCASATKSDKSQVLITAADSDNRCKRIHLMKKKRSIAITIREGIMIDTEMGNWKEFIEAMLRNKSHVTRKAGRFPSCCNSYHTQK
ncbi:protein YpfM [Pantoea sp. Eser]|nr:protein YpfM [Pantoea sp. Eser]